MFGKLAGAWLGARSPARNSGAKGAILGYGAAALARRSVPALAAIVLGGWAFRKWRDRRRRRAVLSVRRGPVALAPRPRPRNRARPCPEA